MAKIKLKKIYNKKQTEKYQFHLPCSNGIMVSYFSFRANITAAENSHRHGTAVVNSQPTMQPGFVAMSQCPPSQAKSALSVFGDGVFETRTDWKIQPRKNEDR